MQSSLPYCYYFCTRKIQMERSKDNSRKGGINCSLYHGLDKTESNLRAWECKHLLNIKYCKRDDTRFAFKYLQGVYVTAHSPVLLLIY